MALKGLSSPWLFMLQVQWKRQRDTLLSCKNLLLAPSGSASNDSGVYGLRSASRNEVITLPT